MRRQVSPIQTQAAPRERTWPAFLANAEVLMVSAAFGLIAAIVIGAPHLRLP
ncbi:hypothetical protein LPW26_06705 [Rhodopseudomonas sp. HC1]|uniref:hypothetical protein n=1 Tax=Rhodopseudomonas infernalis TaxID=2897386 RepID=UPI001EE91283|nr:hypothetical protein [Rhodopseudomonas infernalis]MCG6204318.1 hypothetical protein [Rhodopseudomonas infernalis]